jgi:hypothetical protein
LKFGIAGCKSVRASQITERSLVVVGGFSHTRQVFKNSNRVWSCGKGAFECDTCVR